jgi:6-pyruvoyltetrahydropterin/6-carboxytetrahydropterin synthase
MTFKVKRYHDISCGHRVVGHEGKCRHLHGHNYRIHFVCESSELDNVGRVIDFSDIKARLCMWLEDEWDHKMLVWQHDEMLPGLKFLDPTVVAVPFNPTAENLAEYLVRVIGPMQLLGTGIRLVACEIEETRKCSAVYEV